MSMHDVDGLNAGYASALLEQYLENPEAVPREWRALFESGDERARRGPSRPRAPARDAARTRTAHAAPPSPAAPSRTPAAAGSRSRPARSRRPADAADEALLGGVAAAMALVKAHRTHGHLAARLDPLGSEPLGDPALEPRAPRAEADARAPGADPGLRCSASTSPARRSPTRCRACARPTAGTIAYEIEHISDHERARLAARGDRVGPATASRSPPTSKRACSSGSPRSRASSATSAARSSARSSSRSRGSTCWCRCSTRRSSSPPTAARTRS